jgi:hypothetical protein
VLSLDSHDDKHDERQQEQGESGRTNERGWSMKIDHYTMTVNFRDDTQIIHENVYVVSVDQGVVGMSDNEGNKWVYPIDTIKSYHFKAIEVIAAQEGYD